MKILNLYYSMTGNTEKVAERIAKTVAELGHDIDTVKVTGKDTKLEILQYEFVFVGSGVYAQLPGQPLMDLYRTLLLDYVKKEEIKPRVVVDLPDWQVGDAIQTNAFLESRPGKKLLDRLRFTATAMCLDDEHCDAQLSADRRAFALVIMGLESMADEEYWRSADGEMDDELIESLLGDSFDDLAE